MSSITTFQYISILLIIINHIYAIDYSTYRIDSVRKSATRDTARTTRQILEKLSSTPIKNSPSLQKATEHLLHYGALLRSDILDMLGKLVYNHYDDFSIAEIDALFRIYQDTLERKYNIFDIVPSVLKSGDTRTTSICSFINKQVHSCLKESSSTCMKLNISDSLNHKVRKSRALTVTQKIYKSGKLSDYYHHRFSLPVVLKALKTGRLRLTAGLLSGLLLNVQYDSFDDQVRSAEKELVHYLARNPDFSTATTSLTTTKLQETYSISNLLRDFLSTANFPSKIKRNGRLLSQHVGREVSAINENIELLGTVYDNGTINLRYLFQIVLPNDTVDDDIMQARDYLVAELERQNIVEKYLNVEKYQQAGPDQLLMELLGQLRDIGFAIDLVRALHVHARFWHTSHMVKNLNDLLSLFDAFDNLRGLPTHSAFIAIVDKVKSKLFDSKNVSIEMSCSNPRKCLQFGLQLIQQCSEITRETRALIASFMLTTSCKQSYESVIKSPVHERASTMHEEKLKTIRSRGSETVKNDIPKSRHTTHSTRHNKVTSDSESLSDSSQILTSTIAPSEINTEDVNMLSDSDSVIEKNSPDDFEAQDSEFIDDAGHKSSSLPTSNPTSELSNSCEDEEDCNESVSTEVSSHYSTEKHQKRIHTDGSRKKIQSESQSSSKSATVVPEKVSDDSGESNEESCEECVAAETSVKNSTSTSTESLPKTNCDGLSCGKPAKTKDSRITSKGSKVEMQSPTSLKLNRAKSVQDMNQDKPIPTHKTLCQHRDQNYRRQLNRLDKVRRITASRKPEVSLKSTKQIIKQKAEESSMRHRKTNYRNKKLEVDQNRRSTFQANNQTFESGVGSIKHLKEHSTGNMERVVSIKKSNQTYPTVVTEFAAGGHSGNYAMLNKSATNTVARVSDAISQSRRAGSIQKIDIKQHGAARNSHGYQNQDKMELKTDTTSTLNRSYVIPAGQSHHVNVSTYSSKQIVSNHPGRGSKTLLIDKKQKIGSGRTDHIADVKNQGFTRKSYKSESKHAQTGAQKATHDRSTNLTRSVQDLKTTNLEKSRASSSTRPQTKSFVSHNVTRSIGGQSNNTGTRRRKWHIAKVKKYYKNNKLVTEIVGRSNKGNVHEYLKKYLESHKPDYNVVASNVDGSVSSPRQDGKDRSSKGKMVPQIATRFAHEMEHLNTQDILPPNNTRRNLTTTIGSSFNDDDVKPEDSDDVSFLTEPNRNLPEYIEPEWKSSRQRISNMQDNQNLTELQNRMLDMNAPLYIPLMSYLRNDRVSSSKNTKNRAKKEIITDDSLDESELENSSS